MKTMMRKTLAILITLIMVLGLLPMTAWATDESAETGTAFYFVPNENWLKDGARFAAYVFGDMGENTWIDLIELENDPGVYGLTIPEGYTYVIFCRMNGTIATNDWNYKWNQTADLTIPTDGTNCYTYSEGVWDSGRGVWSTFTPSTPNVIVPEGAIEITDTYEGLDANEFGTYSAENGWTPLDLETGKYIYFVVGLNAGDTLYFDFSEATQYQLYIVGDPNPEIINSATTPSVTVDGGGTYHVLVSSNVTAKVYIVPAEDGGETETVEVNLMLKAIDAEGKDISGSLDAILNDGEWVGTVECDYQQVQDVLIGENTLSGWDYCPVGYVRPDYDITFTADAEGNITITSDNATLEKDGDINYIVVTLQQKAGDIVIVDLMLKAVDADGNAISGSLDAILNGGEWVGTADAAHYQSFEVQLGENTLSGWDYCPVGYVRPDYDITFTADAEGNITITSDNATLEKDGDINYIVVTLVAESTGGDTPDPLPDTITVYFQNNWLWEDVRIFYWMDDAESLVWPGDAMTLYGNDGIYDIYSYELPADATYFIINGIKDDGSGALDQTPDISVESAYDGICYYMMWDNGNTVGSESVDVILPPEPASELTGAALALGSDLSIIFKASIGDVIEDNEVDFGMMFEMNGKTTLVSDYEALGDGIYAFTFEGIAPQQMGDLIHCTLVTLDEENETVRRLASLTNYSVKRNAIKLMSEYPDDTKLITLLADLLTYGAAAQVYKSYKTDALVTDGLTLVTSTATPSAQDAMTVVGNTNAHAYFSAAGLWFDHVNNLYVKINVADEASEVYLYVDNSVRFLDELEALGNGVYKFTSDALYATNFTNEHVFDLVVGEDRVATLTYSVNAYAYGILQSETEPEAMKDLALALYRYGVSATAYTQGN